MKDLFYCYSKRLNDYLNIFGFEYVKHGVSDKTGNEYRAYNKCEELMFALDNWNMMKQYFELDKVKKRNVGKINKEE